MPIYIQKTINSDISEDVFANKEMSVGSGVNADLVITGLTNSNSETVFFITPSGVPNSNGWPDGGTWLVELQVAVTNSDVLCKMRCVRFGASSPPLQSGSFTSTQVLSQNRSFLPVVPDWNDDDEDSANRLAIEMVFSASLGFPQSVTIGLGDISRNIVSTNVTENFIQSDASLFAIGHVLVSSGLDLVVNGLQPLTDQLDLFLSGKQTESDNVALFIQGHNIITSDLNFTTTGKDANDTALDLVLLSFDIIDSTLDLIVRGHIVINNNLDMVIRDPKDIISSQMTLFIGPFVLSDLGLDLFIIGNDTINDNLTLLINGNTPIESGLDLFTIGHTPFFDDIDLFLLGHLPNSSSLDLVVPDINDVIDSNITLFIGSFVVGDEGFDLFIGGKDNFSGNLDLITVGHISMSGDIDLFIVSKDIFFGNLDLIVDGHIVNSDNIILVVPDAKDINNAELNLFLSPFNVINNNSTLLIHGSQISNNNLDLVMINSLDSISNNLDLITFGSGIIPFSGLLFPLCINGMVVKTFDPADPPCPPLDPLASIQISNELIGIYQSRIDALINQLGKNIILEFEKIKVRCPNCKFDTMRGRSTGIHIPGGPRPFARGRRCPWCKGNGFEEVDNNKCIKALLKWNPKDAINYGITLSDHKDVVRIKTFLTELDDLVRSKTVVANADITNIAILRVKLLQSPIPVGLREDRYCISFWELL